MVTPMMEKKLIVVVMMVVIFVGSGSAVNCPANFTKKVQDNSGQEHCLYESNNAVKFCEALRACKDRGGELLQNPQLFSKVLSSAEYWVGVTDLQNERQYAQDGWRYTNGDVAIDGSGGIIWKATKPNYNNDEDDCAKLQYGKLDDKPCNDDYKFVCHHVPHTKPTTKVFHRQVLPNYSQVFNGCYEMKTVGNMENLCAIECFKMAECVAFYYYDNKAADNCLLVQFTDSRFKDELENGYTAKYTSQP